MCVCGLCDCLAQVVCHSSDASSESQNERFKHKYKPSQPPELRLASTDDAPGSWLVCMGARVVSCVSRGVCVFVCEVASILKRLIPHTHLTHEGAILCRCKSKQKCRIPHPSSTCTSSFCAEEAFLELRVIAKRLAYVVCRTCKAGRHITGLYVLYVFALCCTHIPPACWILPDAAEFP
jgi:hypothetical protein